MKSNIHPNYQADAVITCSSCNAKHEIGTVKGSFTVSICSNCHPFYTGSQQKIIDTSNKISDYQAKFDKFKELKKRKEEIEKAKQERLKSKVGVISSADSKMSLRDLLKAKGK